MVGNFLKGKAVVAKAVDRGLFMVVVTILTVLSLQVNDHCQCHVRNAGNCLWHLVVQMPDVQFVNIKALSLNQVTWWNWRLSLLSQIIKYHKGYQ